MGGGGGEALRSDSDSEGAEGAKMNNNKHFYVTYSCFFCFFLNSAKWVLPSVQTRCSLEGNKQSVVSRVAREAGRGGANLCGGRSSV